MPLIVTVNTIAECLRTDCNILGDLKKKVSPTKACMQFSSPPHVWNHVLSIACILFSSPE